MRRRGFHPWPVAVVGLALAFYGLVLLAVQAHGQSLTRVGGIMQPSSGGPPGGGGSGFAILTESSSIITTESGDPLRTE